MGGIIKWELLFLTIQKNVSIKNHFTDTFDSFMS